ncbi:hypothetical protein Pcinc_043298 [Petrolisthes cinctipes]|uniref:Uncharacterized protein n=1 Tax=Petrolisthes cinctipes TaxID=88211 RepID=A0AAE1BHW1_PETCI|nr:hypothetical protein Pcinc_043298 [Petrolisthes cinctipes]
MCFVPHLTSPRFLGPLTLVDAAPGRVVVDEAGVMVPVDEGGGGRGRGHHTGQAQRRSLLYVSFSRAQDLYSQVSYGRREGGREG